MPGTMVGVSAPFTPWNLKGLDVELEKDMGSIAVLDQPLLGVNKKKASSWYLSGKQGTVSEEIQFTGKGLHQGDAVTMTIKPAKANTGLVFVRNGHEIRAIIENVTDTFKATKLSDGNNNVLTPEHILSALGSIGVDNAYIYLNAEEVPIFDGSASAFRDKLLASGATKELDAERKIFSIEKPIIFSREGEGIKVLVLPASQKELRLSYFIEFANPGIKNQFRSIVLNKDSFWQEIANCRTFIEKEHLEELAKSKRYLGIDNGNAAVLLDKNGKSTGKGFSVKNEAVRHKILDLFGDLQLAGISIYGHVIAIEAGHRDHNALLRKIVQTYHSGQHETYTKAQRLKVIRKFKLLSDEKKVPEELYYEVLQNLSQD